MGWTEKYPDGCVSCGTTEAPHYGQGRCSSCYGKARRRGKITAVKKVVKRRMRDGVWQYYCFTCDSWKDEDQFYAARRVMCAVCRRKEHRDDYYKRWDVIQARRRKRSIERAAEGREAHKAHAKRGSSWTRNVGVVDQALLLPWIEELRLLLLREHEGLFPLAEGEKTKAGDGWRLVATSCNLDERSIYRIRSNESLKVSFDVAEKIALACGKMEELYETLPMGKKGWSKEHDYCQRCGISEAPHYARGYCHRCYSAVQWHESNGTVPTIPRSERWSIRHLCCVDCGKTKSRHLGRGLCARCYNVHIRAAQRKGVKPSVYLDALGYRVDYPTVGAHKHKRKAA